MYIPLKVKNMYTAFVRFCAANRVLGANPDIIRPRIAKKTENDLDVSGAKPREPLNS